MNIAEAILARASGGRPVTPGEMVNARVDVAMVNDITGPLTVRAFKELGARDVWDKRRVVIVLDHHAPASSEGSAGLHRILRDFAADQGIENYYGVGDGICHQLMMEAGHVRPGELIVGADSHTCTYGALGAFGTAIGSTEMAAVFAEGELWFRVPETIRIEIEGALSDLVTPKDVILQMIDLMGCDGATYKAIEFGGSTIEKMDISGRMTLCNMAVEMGAKTAIVEPDEKTIQYVRDRTRKPFEVVRSDPGAHYERVSHMDVSRLGPRIACPPSVDNVKPVEDVGEVEVDQALLGSCTNGRLEDLRLAARILMKRRIHRGVRMLVIPASRGVYEAALRDGLVEIFVRSGAIVCNPTCGPCFGGHMGLLAEDEVCISSSNRNFLGRMGSSKGHVYLASPATVAASAIAGKITDPRELHEGAW